MWSEQSSKDKKPYEYEQKAGKLKKKYEKDLDANCAKGKSEAGKNGPGRPTGSKKNEPEDKKGEVEEEDEMMRRKMRRKNKWLFWFVWSVGVQATILLRM
ncbi:High mobility group protein B2 [Lemmus lemmus]